MVKSKPAFALVALAVLLTLLPSACDGGTAQVSPLLPPTPTAIAPLPSPSPIPFDTATPVPTGTPRVQRSLAHVSLHPTTPEGWAASIIVSGQPNATESGPIGADGHMYVSWAVTNTGSEDAESPFSVDVLVDGVPVERWLAASGLDVGDVQTIRDWIDLPVRVNLAPGPHELQLVVDSTGYLQPLETPGNSVSVMFDWPELPNGEQPPLAPERLPNLMPFLPEGWQNSINLQGVPRTIEAAMSATPSMQIAYQNGGLSSIGRFFLVYVYLDGVLVAKFNQHGLIADEAVVSPPWMHLLDTIYVTPGSHTLTLELDPTGLVEESDETDNIVTIPINWAGPAIPDPASPQTPEATEPLVMGYVPSGWSGPLVVSSYLGETSLQSAGYLSSQAYVSWAMRNSGAPIQSPYTVELLVSGAVVHTWEREGLEAGAVDFLVDDPIPAAFAQGIHNVELRVRTSDGEVTGIARRPTNWRTGFAPPRDGGPLDAAERRSRLAALEGIRSSNEPLSNSPQMRQDVIDIVDLVYQTLYNRSLSEEGLGISILSDEEFSYWVDAECNDVAPALSSSIRNTYLARCAQAKGFIGYYSEWRGASRIVARSDRTPMDVLSTIAHELGHFRQAEANSSLNEQVNLDVVALREAQAYAHQVVFFRTLESLAGLDLLLYPRLSGYENFIQMRVGELRARAETSEHARGQLVLWLAVLSDPELRQERTALLNNRALPTQTARAVFDYLVDFSPTEARLYVNRIMGNASAQIGAIESLVSARLIPGLPYWNEGSPELREVGLLLP
jgi:hypothetical protein